MLSKNPSDIDKISGEERDKEILRQGIIAELDAINLYKQLAEKSEDENLKKVLEDIAGEEKTHIGEFQSLLLEKDKEQVQELESGRKEVQEVKEEGGGEEGEDEESSEKETLSGEEAVEATEKEAKKYEENEEDEE